MNALFSRPRIEAAQRADGCLLLRSADPLQDYPATVLHSFRMDTGEITDKGYVNQRQVLANRSALVDLLYTWPPPAGVVVAGAGA